MPHPPPRPTVSSSVEREALALARGGLEDREPGRAAAAGAGVAHGAGTARRGGLVPAAGRGARISSTTTRTTRNRNR